MPSHRQHGRVVKGAQGPARHLVEIPHQLFLIERGEVLDHQVPQRISKYDHVTAMTTHIGQSDARDEALWTVRKEVNVTAGMRGSSGSECTQTSKPGSIMTPEVAPLPDQVCPQLR